MEPAAAYITAAVVVLLLLVAAAYAWYHRPSKWVQFSYAGGDKVSFSTGGLPINRLRFKSCVFRTANPAGTARQWDVTGVLNGMAAAYDVKGISKSALTLGGSQQIPLNPFSFKLGGFNDESVVDSAAASMQWGTVPAAATSLVGKVRLI